METEKNYLIKVFGLGYTGQYTLPLSGIVDADRINDEATHLIITKKMILERDKFYSHNVRITYEEL
jgi:hypothetical protein|tara:strand:- start:480 stop:677 length:198 start_codon:yes stop_codon:yes gene_type:complete